MAEEEGFDFPRYEGGPCWHTLVRYNLATENKESTDCGMNAYTVMDDHHTSIGILKRLAATAKSATLYVTTAFALPLIAVSKTISSFGSGVCGRQRQWTSTGSISAANSAKNSSIASNDRPCARRCSGRFKTTNCPRLKEQGRRHFKPLAEFFNVLLVHLPLAVQNLGDNTLRTEQGR